MKNYSEHFINTIKTGIENNYLILGISLILGIFMLTGISQKEVFRKI